MKKVILAAIVLGCMATTAYAELQFIHDKNGITSHVVYNGGLIPVNEDGMVNLDGHDIPIATLTNISHPRTVSKKPQLVTTEGPEEEIDLDNTKRAAKREAKNEARKAVGNKTGSNVVGAFINDVIDSFF